MASPGAAPPTWSTTCASYRFTAFTGRIHRIQLPGKQHLELVHLNTGNVDSDHQRIYEPFPLPVTADFWVVFTSIREYGNTYQGGNVQKQLWVAAIDTSPNPCVARAARMRIVCAAVIF